MVDIDIVGRNGETPIYIAAKFNSLASLMVLINRHASTTIANKDGENPLHAASRFGHLEVCKVIT